MLLLGSEETTGEYGIEVVDAALFDDNRLAG
jgi:hypothetical protein